MTNIMSLLTCVDNKLFRNKSKQDAYSKQRSHVKMQLWIVLVMYGTVIFCIYSYCEGRWVVYLNMVSPILSNIINIVMMFQYVNIVLMIKHRYHLVENTLSEAAITYDGTFSTRTDKEHSMSIRNINSNKTLQIKI
jgi:membrane protein YdbS with pleckstrin-like domain